VYARKAEDISEFCNKWVSTFQSGGIENIYSVATPLKTPLLKDPGLIGLRGFDRPE
jgi:hypothetical protein